MSIPILGVLFSGIALTGFFLLLRYEMRKGVRFLSGIRRRLDLVVLRISAFFSNSSRFAPRRMIRQTVHYVFHRMLTSLLYFLEQFEHRVKDMLRSNKRLARRLDAQTDRPKNKLDEIAEHKQSVALTEAEKKKRKQKSLEG